MKQKKLKIAVTGSIGSGKTSFCKILERSGLPVIYADELAKELLASDKKVKSKIIRRFGEESFKDGQINRRFLADKVFSDPYNVILINQIVHPVVKNEIENKIKELFETCNIVVVEAALIYEADMEKMFDFVVLITADRIIRQKRKLDSDNISPADFEKRDASQIPDEEKKKRVDFVFVNNASLDDLKKKAELFLQILKTS